MLTRKVLHTDPGPIDPPFLTPLLVPLQSALTRDVLQQLQRIASQQSRIREMKDKLAVFGEARGRQDAAVSELLAVRRLPAAYKQCLAECVRR